MNSSSIFIWVALISVFTGLIATATYLELDGEIKEYKGFSVDFATLDLNGDCAWYDEGSTTIECSEGQHSPLRYIYCDRICGNGTSSIIEFTTPYDTLVTDIEDDEISSTLLFWFLAIMGTMIAIGIALYVRGL